MRKSAATSIEMRFDIFLSHSHEDSEVISGVKEMIEQEGLTAYVDWIDDPQTDRSRVTADTADMLRKRMKNCNCLLYVSTKTSTKSKWMPWELGYFDGMKPGNVGLLPVVESPGNRFVGQEYLGLYPYYEYIDFTVGRHLGHYISNTKAKMLKTAARGSR